jgi:hypothetical protein
MPLPALSPQEIRLGRFAGVCCALYSLGGLVFAAFPAWTFEIAGLGEPARLGPEVRFWQVLAVSLMAACAVSCALVAHAPRERRVALLPVLMGQLTSSLLAVVILFAVGPHGWAHTAWRAVMGVAAANLPLFALSIGFYRSASPGAHLSVVPTQPAPAEPPLSSPAPVRLTSGGGKPLL